MPKTKNKLTNFLVLIFTVLFFILLLEISSYLIYSKNQIKTQTIKSNYIEKKDSYYGYVLNPNSSYNVIKKTEKFVCYNVIFL